MIINIFVEIFFSLIVNSKASYFMKNYPEKIPSQNNCCYDILAKL